MTTEDEFEPFLDACRDAIAELADEHDADPGAVLGALVEMVFEMVAVVADGDPVQMHEGIDAIRDDLQLWCCEGYA